MLPTGERLKPFDLPCFKIQYRLVMDLELASLQRLTHLGLELQFRRRRGAHRLVEDLVAATSLGLGRVHCNIGVAQHFLGGGWAFDAGGYADAGRDEYLASRNVERFFQVFQDSVGNLERVVRTDQFSKQDDEFVTAKARHKVARAGPKL